MDKVREIIFYKNHFEDFFESQPTKVQDKIAEVLFMMSVVERVPKKFFQHMEGTNGLFEVRIEFAGNIYRVFSCFDKGNLVILFNGFQKKSQKTPTNELEKAERLKVEYFKSKDNESKR